MLDLQTTVDTPRPKVELLSKSVQPGANRSPVQLKGQDELPQDGRLSFFLKTEVPESFPRTEKIEVSSQDDSFHVLLSVNDGNLILQNSQTLLAVLDPLKSFGPSAFGPLRFRPVARRRRKRGLAATGNSGANSDTYRNSLPRQPGQAMPADRFESLPDRLGGIRLGIHAFDFRAGRISGFHVERAAPERNAALHQAAR